MKVEQATDLLTPAARMESTGFNVKDLLVKYYHYLWLFILAIAIALMCAWAYLRYTPVKYTVSATLLVKNSGSRPGENADVFSDFMLFKENSNKQTEIQILRSRSLMVRVVKALELQYSYNLKGNVRTTNLYKESPVKLEFIPPFDSSRVFQLDIHITGPNSFSIGEDPQEYNFGQIITRNSRKFRLIQQESAYSKFDYKDYVVRWVPEERVAMSILGGLEVVGAEDGSNLLKISYTTENTKFGADIINTLMAEYSKAGVEDKSQINLNILSFVDDRLQFVEKQLDSVEKDLQTYRTNKQVVDLSAQSAMYFNNMTETEKSIQQQEVQLQVIQLLEDYLQDSSRNLSLVPSTLGISDVTLQQLTSGYNELLIARSKEMQTGATENSPVVKNIDEEIDAARHKLLKNLANIRFVFQKNMEAYYSQNKELQNQLASIPQKERENLERTRQQEIKQNLYLYLLQKKEESGIAQASITASSKILDEALNSGMVVSPNPPRIYLLAIVGGLMLPLVIIHAIDLLNDKVTVKTDITRATNMPIIAEIGHSPEESNLVLLHNSRSLVAEQVRILRSNLRFLLMDKTDKMTIMITSSFSGEGKSFVSINLGAAMALSGKKTIILEFDLRKPKIVAGLGLTRTSGLTNYLIGSSSIPQLVQPVPKMENLYVLPCGPIPPNPSEILLSDKVPELFSWLQTNYDIVIIDTAPVGLVSDSMSLSQYADATLFILRQRYTFKRQLQFIEDIYQNKKLPNPGLVINDVISKGATSYYGYGGSYGYGYGYGSNNGYYDGDGSSGKWRKWSRKFRRKKKDRDSKSFS